MLKGVEHGKRERQMLARLKRISDTQRISEMKSSVGIEPAAIFPEEIWRMIFCDKTLDPSDKYNIAKSSSQFQAWIEDTIVGDVLFPLTLKFEVPHFWAQLLSRCCGGTMWRLTGKKCKHSLAEYSNLRRVSKILRDGVDVWHEDNIKLAIENSCSEHCIPSVTLTLYLFDPSNTVKLDQMLNDILNPNLPLEWRFYRRSLKIVLFQDLSFGPQVANDFTIAYYKLCLQSFVEKIISLLTKIGEQIWCFRLYIPYDCTFESVGLGARDIYEFLYKWLSLMPNLKFLDIDIDMYSDDASNPTNETVKLSSNKTFITLPHLKRISLNADGSNMGILKMFLSILKANVNVKYLDIESEKDFTQKLPEAARFIRRSSRLEGYTSQYHISRSILSYKWPLKQLTLVLCPCPSIDKLFAQLNSFQSLEVVDLKSFDKVVIGIKPQKLVQLQLPKLKTFEFTYFPTVLYLKNQKSVLFYFGLQFLINCETLETIRYRACLSRHDQSKVFGAMVMAKDNFGMSLFSPKSSQIWNVFSKLERLNIKYSPYKTDTDIRRAERIKNTNDQ